MHPRRSYGRWRLLFIPPRTGPEKRARDIGLQARAARTDETVFSIYGWSRPTLSFGRNQPARELYDREKIQAADIDVVRRPTGGRAILHHREVTYSVTAPIATVSLRETYASINRTLRTGLSRVGVSAVTIASPQRAPAPVLPTCFHK